MSVWPPPWDGSFSLVEQRILVETDAFVLIEKSQLYSNHPPRLSNIEHYFESLEAIAFECE